MTFDLPTILAGKQARRAQLAALPIVEKLRMLDAMRERAVTLREAATAAKLHAVPTAKPATNADGLT